MTPYYYNNAEIRTANETAAAGWLYGPFLSGVIKKYEDA